MCKVLEFYTETKMSSMFHFKLSLNRNLTPELTGRGHNLEIIQVLDKSNAIRAPVE
jgi:hypothetical protein